MAEYYLLSQLPSLDGYSGDIPIPITEERFEELCKRFLSKSALNKLSKATLVPLKIFEKSGSDVIDSWNENERKFRHILANLRADKLNKRYECDEADQNRPELVSVAREAVGFDDPLEAEKFLNCYRLGFLESIRPMDSFSEDFVFYYAIKLKLISRIKQFDAGSGTRAYKNIYDSIINGERTEVAR